MKRFVGISWLSLATLVWLLGPSLAKPIRELPKREPTPKQKEVVRAEWTMDLGKMSFPEQALAGIVTCDNFKLEWAHYNGNVLTLKEQGGRAQLIIFLFLQKGDPLAGRSWMIVPDQNQDKTPHVHFHGRARNGAFGGKYAMKLDFAQAKDGKTQGRIYLCLPDADRTFVAGTFDVEQQ